MCTTTMVSSIEISYIKLYEFKHWCYQNFTHLILDTTKTPRVLLKIKSFSAYLHAQKSITEQNDYSVCTSYP